LWQFNWPPAIPRVEVPPAFGAQAIEQHLGDKIPGLGKLSHGPVIRVAHFRASADLRDALLLSD
jgi:hypothetical protein